MNDYNTFSSIVLCYIRTRVVVSCCVIFLHSVTGLHPSTCCVKQRRMSLLVKNVMLSFALHCRYWNELGIYSETKIPLLQGLLWSLACIIDGLVWDCRNSTALAMELLQSCAEPSTYLLNPLLLGNYMQIVKKRLNLKDSFASICCTFSVK